MSAPKNVDDYIAAFPPKVRKRLQEMRRAIRNAAPHAEEAIKYAIPTFVLNGNLISFAGYEHHIGLYPAPLNAPEFKDALSPYASGKATARFPLDEPLPVALITKIVKRRVAEMAEKKKGRKGGKG